MELFIFLQALFGSWCPFLPQKGQIWHLKGQIWHFRGHFWPPKYDYVTLHEIWIYMELFIFLQTGFGLLDAFLHVKGQICPLKWQIWPI